MSDVYPWERFWIPRDELLRLDDDGLLPDPELDSAWAHDSKAAKLEGLLARPILILLGEPGIGKSTALQQAKDAAEAAITKSGDLVIWRNLNEYSSEDRLVREVFRNQSLLKCKRRQRVVHLFLDSLDECQLDVRNLFSLLLAEVGKLPLTHLRLRIVCRTGVWSEEFEEQLLRLWSAQTDACAFELAPLRRADIELAVTSRALDPTLFLAEMRKADIGPLAARPITLKMLMDEFAHNGHFFK